MFHTSKGMVDISSEKYVLGKDIRFPSLPTLNYFNHEIVQFLTHLSLSIPVKQPYSKSLVLITGSKC